MGSRRRQASSRRRQGHRSPRSAPGSCSALDEVPPIAQLRNNQWTRLPIHYNTPHYLGTLCTNTSGSNIIPSTISSPLLPVGEYHLAAGTVGGDVLLWDLRPVVIATNATLQQDDRRSVHMPSAVFQPAVSEMNCRVILVLTCPGREQQPQQHQHDDGPSSTDPETSPTATSEDYNDSPSTLLALCATGLIHSIAWSSYEKKNRITHSWWSPEPIAKGALLDTTTLVLAYHMTVRAYRLPPKTTSSFEPKLLWTLRTDSVVHDIVPLGEQLLVLILAGGSVQVVDVRTLQGSSSASNHLVLATPGREIVLPSPQQHRSNGCPTTSLSHRLSATQSVVCLQSTLVVVLETIPSKNDTVEWGVTTDHFDEIQLPYSCAGLGSLGESTVVACLAAGTTYVWDRAGTCCSFGLPVYEPYDDAVGLEYFASYSLPSSAPIFLYQWPMGVIEVFGLAVEDSPLLEALIVSGVADELRTVVLTQQTEDTLWAAAHDELKVTEETERLTLALVQTKPAFRSLLLSLTSQQ